MKEINESRGAQKRGKSERNKESKQRERMSRKNYENEGRYKTGRKIMERGKRTNATRNERAEKERETKLNEKEVSATTAAECFPPSATRQRPRRRSVCPPALSGKGPGCTSRDGVSLRPTPARVERCVCINVDCVTCT